MSDERLPRLRVSLEEPGSDPGSGPVFEAVHPDRPAPVSPLALAAGFAVLAALVLVVLRRRHDAQPRDVA